jgi:chorismate--pyruvate lyase
MNHFESTQPWSPTPKPSFSAIQKRWLMKQGALTQALRMLGPLKLRVLDEYPAGACRDEAYRLNSDVRHPVWVREIVMSIDGIPCLVARSVTWLNASHGVWQGMRRLRSRPLADILYDDVAIVRSNFEVARLNKQTALYRTVQAIKNEFQPLNPSDAALLARRSVFLRQGSPLLVAECFLPGFWDLV